MQRETIQDFVKGTLLKRLQAIDISSAVANPPGSFWQYKSISWSQRLKLKASLKGAKTEADFLKQL